MNQERFSRFLVKILRHNPHSRNLEITEDGHIDVEDILKLPESSGFNENDVTRVVEDDIKSRFSTRYRSGKLQIKATQGHSIPVNLNLKLITKASEASVALHGTFLNKWEQIKRNGLSRMNRNHIHFSSCEIGAKCSIPPKQNIIISLDVEKLIKAGIKLYISENGVLLSPGDKHGCITKEYFKCAYHRNTGEALKMN